MKKAVVAVLLPREHLPFIRGWCEHHLQQGFDVHLYDNTGSTGSTRRTSSFAKKRWVATKTDKRHRPYGRWTKDKTDEEVSALLRAEVDLPGVTVHAWQPKVRGKIVHGQVEAYADFIRRFREEYDWAAFIDCDEYLEARAGWSWDALLEQSADLGRVRILGDSWECRWTMDGRPRRIEDLKFVEAQGLGGVKNLVMPSRVEYADLHSYWQLHGAASCWEADPRQFGFRHHANPRESELALKKVTTPGRNAESVKI